MDITSIARGLSVGVLLSASVSADAGGVNIAVNQQLNQPALAVQSTASTGDNVASTATVNDGDGFTTTAVTLLNGATPVGSMTNAGGGNWTLTMNSIGVGTYQLIARRITSGGSVDSATRTLVVSNPGGGTGNMQVNTGTGNLQVNTGTGNVQVS